MQEYPWQFCSCLVHFRRDFFRYYTLLFNISQLYLLWQSFQHKKLNQATNQAILRLFCLQKRPSCRVSPKPGHHPHHQLPDKLKSFARNQICQMPLWQSFWLAHVVLICFERMSFSANDCYRLCSSTCCLIFIDQCYFLSPNKNCFL